MGGGRLDLTTTAVALQVGVDASKDERVVGWAVPVIHARGRAHEHAIKPTAMMPSG